MKFISIIPTKFMKDALMTSDTTLVLSHLIQKGNAYQKACLDFKKHGGKIYCDNSFYEKQKNPPNSELAYKANLVKADVLCLPDLPMSPYLAAEIKKNIREIRGYGYYGKLMMCVWAQGTDWNEDLEFFKILNNEDELDIIAIPYCFNKREKDKYNRPYFLDMIEKNFDVKNIMHGIHLFGVASWSDLKKSNRWWINSIDGTLPWKEGYANNCLPISIKKESHRPKHYFEIKKITKKQRACINYNCQKIKEELKR